MIISGYSDSLDWVISMEIHTKVTNYYTNGWKQHIPAINSAANDN